MQRPNSMCQDYSYLRGLKQLKRINVAAVIGIATANGASLNSAVGGENRVFLAFTDFGDFGTIPPRFLASTAAVVAEGARRRGGVSPDEMSPVMDDLVDSKEC